ncbi:MAG: hypothetical protein KGO48_17820, partial [Alphaproteobacteria bacterium]|nr:hypothetical protein [Alphaproteobacteria bacterium]
MFVLNWLWAITRKVLNAVAGVIVFLVLAAIIVVIVTAIRGDGIASNSVLELDLRNTMDDKASPGLFALGGNKLSIMDVVLGLDEASR